MNNLIRSIKPKSLNRRQSRYRYEHDTCVLCSAELVLKFETIPATDKHESSAPTVVREVAECLACRVRARSTDHSVQ